MLVSRVLVGVLALGLCAVAAPAIAVPAERLGRVGPTLAVTGYALGDLAPALVDANAAGLRTVTVDGIGLNGGGSKVTAPTTEMQGLATRAHGDGLRAELLVSNYRNAVGDFDTAAVGRLLRSPAHVTSVAHQVATYAISGGWDGVNVDLEALRRGDGPGLVSFLQQLRAQLPTGLTISIDVSAATSPAAFLAGGYRLAEIAATVDVVQLMAYDLHGPTWSGPGPIGPLTWQRRSLAALLTVVPAAQVDLGVAGYGYTWPVRGTGRDVTVKQARAKAATSGVEPRWHAGSGEWSARLADGTTMWWSDGRSYLLRVDLARSLGLHGLAVWRLGSADLLASVA